MLRDTRRVPHAEYVSLAMSHRFCLVAPGDFVSTHKITEAMAIGGAGGCIPVFVITTNAPLPINTARDVATLLPYTRWLDYCTVGYFVRSVTAAANFSAVLERLQAVSAAEAESKLERLRGVHSAFIFRHGSTEARPSAPELIMAEACATSAHLATSGSTAPPLATNDVDRCTLG